MRQEWKVVALAGLFAWAGAGISGRGASASLTAPFEPAEPQVATSPSGAFSARPRFLYGPGASGLGYYQTRSPGAVPPPGAGPAVFGYPGPGRQAPARRTGGRVRDWTTGHSLPSGGLMSKPWLRPR